MGHRAQIATRVIALGLLTSLIACPAKHKPTATAVSLAFARGGTVRVGLTADSLGQSGPGDSSLDPQREYIPEPFEILRCCLTRTLYQYSGHPTNQGGAELRPDLAESLPDVSKDGLTWTIHIRKGVHYAPPLAGQEVVAQDFVTALKRIAIVTKPDSGDYAVYYDVIQGYAAYASGKANTISGVATPDPHTLVLTLTTRAGDFADRLVLPGTSPIPTIASVGGEFGVATGHDTGDGRFLVATGPYMFAGSEALTPEAAPKDQKPVSGFQASSKVIHLVRNPSWVPATDPLRLAYPDKIDLFLASDPAQLASDLEKGKIDVIMFGGPPFDYPTELLHRYQSEPALGRTVILPRDSIRYISMNLAVPPFDDVHIRRAANFIIDRQAYLNISGGYLVGQVATHVILDSLEQGRLVNYNPYRTDGPADALEKAKAEVRLSKYDHNHDGICDAAVCNGVRALEFPKDLARAVRGARLVANELALIGIKLKIDPRDPGDFFGLMSTPTAHIPMGIDAGWSKDFLNASNFITPLFAGDRVSNAFTVPGAAAGGCCNYAEVGATSSQLRGWGYRVTSVASADDRINQCLQLIGGPQLDCWTALDEYLTESIVPWVPLLSENEFNAVPARVRNFSIDQWTLMPSLDQIVVSPSPSPSGS